MLASNEATLIEDLRSRLLGKLFLQQSTQIRFLQHWIVHYLAMQH
jgi:hypothetical protein